MSDATPTLQPSPVIALNVGGVVYETTRDTLVTEEGLLRLMFDQDLNEWQGERCMYDATGRPFLDRNGPAFAGVLAYLRTGTAHVPHLVSVPELNAELQYFFPGPDCPIAMTPNMVRASQSKQYRALVGFTPALHQALANPEEACADKNIPISDYVEDADSILLTIGCKTCNCWKRRPIEEIWSLCDSEDEIFPISDVYRLLESQYGAARVSIDKYEHKVHVMFMKPLPKSIDSGVKRKRT